MSRAYFLPHMNTRHITCLVYLSSIYDFQTSNASSNPCLVSVYRSYSHANFTLADSAAGFHPFLGHLVAAFFQR